MKILIVEDSATQAELLESLLKTGRYAAQVEKADSIAEAAKPRNDLTALTFRGNVEKQLDDLAAATNLESIRREVAQIAVLCIRFLER